MHGALLQPPEAFSNESNTASFCSELSTSLCAERGQVLQRLANQMVSSPALETALCSLEDEQGSRSQ